MVEDEIAARARQMAGKVATLPDDVVHELDHPEERVERIRSSTTQILCDMAPVVSWLEVRDSTAADLLKRRLLLVCDQANACVDLPKGDPRAAELLVIAVKTSESIRILAQRIDADRSDRDKGVAIYDVAFVIEEDDAVATDCVKKWFDSKKITAEPIGQCPVDGRKKLYRLSEILSDVKKILSLDARETARYRRALTSKLRTPHDS